MTCRACPGTRLPTRALRRGRGLGAARRHDRAVGDCEAGEADDSDRHLHRPRSLHPGGHRDHVRRCGAAHRVAAVEPHRAHRGHAQRRHRVVEGPRAWWPSASPVDPFTYDGTTYTIGAGQQCAAVPRTSGWGSLSPAPAPSPTACCWPRPRQWPRRSIRRIWALRCCRRWTTCVPRPPRWPWQLQTGGGRRGGHETGRQLGPGGAGRHVAAGVPFVILRTAQTGRSAPRPWSGA